MKFASLFENVGWLAILAMAVSLAFMIVPTFIKKDLKALGWLLAQFIVAVIIVSGIAYWVTVSQNVAPGVAKLLESVMDHALTMIDQGLTK